MRTFRCGSAALLVGVAVAAVPRTALAGPPLICHPVEIGDARSLPWGRKPSEGARSYDLSDLTDGTVSILDGSRSAMVHMETLRRAAVYANRDSTIASQLLGAVMARTLDSEASGRRDALPWLDAGYLAQCYHQLGIRVDPACGTADGVIGYAWVRRALELDPDDAELEFAAAMMTALARTPTHQRHVARARKLVEEGSLVASNLELHAGKYWPSHR